MRSPARALGLLWPAIHPGGNARRVVTAHPPGERVAPVDKWSRQPRASGSSFAVASATDWAPPSRRWRCSAARGRPYCADVPTTRADELLDRLRDLGIEP